jgi:CRISPR-associated endonuclease/helicase Cas3
MTLTSENYDAFFNLAFGQSPAQAPFAYQRRVALDAEMPALINAPTGAGKTAAILGAWLWRRLNNPQSVGRRLVYCLPMRTLVEQTRDVARDAIKNLEAEYEKVGKTPPSVRVLMGGDVDNDWESEPEGECIIIGTQDMLLSRALNRGYAMSRYKWPIHFGLLNNDCLWVFDEVQLMGNGLATSTQLAAFRKRFGSVNQSHSLWMSATLKSDWLKSVDFKAAVDALDVLTLSDADRASAVLSARLKASKTLQCTEHRLPNDIAQFVKEKHQAGTQTLVVVNTVKRAREIYRELNKAYGAGEHPQIELLHSRFRPAERERWHKLFNEKVEAGGAGRIIVATQVIEAGVDISSRLLVTDIAPFSSLVQRFGRCNRNGEYEQAEIFWVDRPTVKELLATKTELEDKDKIEIARPYEWSELEAAQRLLETLSSAALEDLEKVDDEETYQPSHVLRRRDLIDLFDTTPDLSGYDLDISRFVRGGEDRDVSVAWRELNGEKPSPKEPRPTRRELCSVPIDDDLKGLLKNNDAWTFDALAGEWKKAAADNLRAGMTLLLDVKAGGYDKQLGWCGKDAKKPVPIVTDERSELPEAYQSDPLSFPSYAQTLAAHSRETRLALETILNALALPDVEKFRDELLKAAQHHDWGKAHKIFQQTLYGAENANEEFDPLLAKSKSNRKHKRKKFRHELASALALLQTGASGLTVYLAACHHGKVRLSIRALPDESKPKTDEGERLDARFARGIWEGDELPKTDLGDGLIKESVKLDLEPMLLGASESGAKSWLERMIALRDDESLGVFRLAYLESLIRAADVRASKFPQDTIKDKSEEVIQR